MMRYFAAILLPAACLVLFGCANGKPPVQAGAPRSIEPPGAEAPEPNGTSAPPSIESGPPVGQDDQTAPQPAEEQEPAAVEPEPHSEISDLKSEISNLKSETSEAVPVEPPPAALSIYDGYAEILATYVRDDGRVDYGELRRRRLDVKAALGRLDELDPSVYESWSRQEKLAFWINAYNLKMLDIIARNYPIESSWWLRLTWPPSDIRHIEGIWSDYKFIVMDEEFTLAEVERRFFHNASGGGFQTRPYNDPRVYLALTYASQSSPPLRTQPYRGEDLDRQLDDQVRRFLAGPAGLQIDRRNGVVRLSALFKPGWRGKEFVGRYGTDKKFKDREPATRAVLSFLTDYLPREDVEFLEVENYALEYLNFDWRLNDTDKGY